MLYVLNTRVELGKTPNACSSRLVGTTSPFNQTTRKDANWVRRTSWSAEFKTPCSREGVNRISEMERSAMNEARARGRNMTSSGITYTVPPFSSGRKNSQGKKMLQATLSPTA